MSNPECPKCAEHSSRVKEVTLRHHLRFPLSQQDFSDSYYYCANSDCDVAYYSDSHVFTLDCLQSQKQIEDMTVCFCFGITQSMFYEYLKNDQKAQFFEELDNLAYGSECHCKVKNPAGRGCLRVFKKLCE